MTDSMKRAPESCTDPVCGMQVDPTAPRGGHYHLQGKTYYFCNPRCKDRFIEHSEIYLAPGYKPGMPAMGSPSSIVQLGGVKAAAPPHTHAAEPAPEKLVDPVCGMSVDALQPRGGECEHQGERYGFCNPRCREKFLAEPEKYLSADYQPGHAAMSAPLLSLGGVRPASGPAHQTSSTQGADKVYYICPMCPEVRESEPAPCPVCGMALEPEIISAKAQPADDAEFFDMVKRFELGLFFALPLLLLSMGGMLVGAHRLMTPMWQWLQLFLATPIVFGCGWPFLERGARSISRRAPNMFTLIALGVSVAYLWSLALLLARPWLPAQLLNKHGAPELYFEASAVIIMLVLLGQILELRARKQTGSALRALLDLSPKKARKVLGESVVEIDLDAVVLGDLLRVPPGDRVPVDGSVVEGASEIDESMLTGESLPVVKNVGDKVIGGSLNGGGSFILRAERIGSETVLAQIVALVGRAQRSRAPVQKLADRISAYFVPTVVAIAIASFVAWMCLGPEPRLVFALVSAVSVLLVACPCALGLATPMAVTVGMGRGAQMGVLASSAEALERLGKADTLVFDKTGTLTEGRASLQKIEVIGEATEAELLRAAASLESLSRHPFAAAIVAEAKEKGVALAKVESFAAIAGGGLRGMIDGRVARVGSERWLGEEGVDVSAQGAGEGGVYVALDRQLIGQLTLRDAVKASAIAAVAEFKAQGLQLVMLTGDGAEAARNIAEACGIERWESGLRPEEKLARIRAMQREGQVVAFAGDGVNDAPALAAADVGVAMGNGSEAAIEAAGLTLLKGDLAALLRARALSRAVLQTIRQNLFFAFVYNAAGVALAAGVLYPLTGWRFSPVFAAAAMSCSSLSVIGNSLRLWRRPL